MVVVGVTVPVQSNSNRIPGIAFFTVYILTVYSLALIIKSFVRSNDNALKYEA